MVTGLSNLKAGGEYRQAISDAAYENRGIELKPHNTDFIGSTAQSIKTGVLNKNGSILQNKRDAAAGGLYDGDNN